MKPITEYTFKVLAKWLSTPTQIVHFKNSALMEGIYSHAHREYNPAFVTSGYILRIYTQKRGIVIYVGFKWNIYRITLPKTHTRELKIGEYVYLYVTALPTTFGLRYHLIGKLISKKEYETIREIGRLQTKLSLLCRRRNSETWEKIEVEVKKLNDYITQEIKRLGLSNVYFSDTEEVVEQKVDGDIYGHSS